MMLISLKRIDIKVLYLKQITVEKGPTGLCLLLCLLLLTGCVRSTSGQWLIDTIKILKDNLGADAIWLGRKRCNSLTYKISKFNKLCLPSTAERCSFQPDYNFLCKDEHFDFESRVDYLNCIRRVENHLPLHITSSPPLTTVTSCTLKHETLNCPDQQPSDSKRLDKKKTLSPVDQILKD